ncbi:MAG: CPBP family intramembrane metalloprotease [Propionibacteriaceae bacterium]|nr:CPBP family intramembrane metalloprotease [Propionibacteriaceae bacterium]
MRKLQDSSPIRFALAWIGIYIVAVNAGDVLGEQLQLPWLTSVLLVALSVVLVFFVRADDRLGHYGVRRVEPGTLPSTLYYLPLVAMAFVQYAKGLAPDLAPATVVTAVLLVTAVGFIEELLFRGFLLRALRVRGNLIRAIVVSGVTFGVGHIVNLLRGYAVADQGLQLVAAALIGTALAYCVVLTGSILPGVAFHALFNLSGTITNHSTGADLATVGVIAVVMIAYLPFLHARTRASIRTGDPAMAPL